MSEFHFSPRPNRAGEIRWREWGDAAFAEARAADKPVLLAISAVWCHWCHVMDETTYSSDDVIGTINRRFVPIRVDNDRRPDVNARYNQGGWPTTAILTPDGEILRGATYVPPDQMHQLLAQIAAFYADPANRLAIAERTGELRTRRREAGPPDRSAQLRADAADRVFSFLDSHFDERYGGFGTDQKFPQTSALHFLLDRHARLRDDRSREMVLRTLHAMAGGGMYDRVEGAFFRYSTTRDYSVPHFEKMLEDLGGLLLACARASAMFDDAELGRIAIEVRTYLDARLWNAQLEAYGGSQDADETYYALDAARRASATAPYVDPTVYASWNAETARALIIAGPLLSNRGVDASEWTARGIRVLEALWSNLIQDGLLCRYFDHEPHIRGLLSDQAWGAWASLSAFEATGDDVWLARAEGLCRAAETMFDGSMNAYADRLQGDEAPGRLAERAFPLDDNALMSRALLNLGSFLGVKSWQERAVAVLESFADSYRGYGMFAAGFASAVLDRFAPPVTILVAGARDHARTRALREAARGFAMPIIAINSADPSRDGTRLDALGQTTASSDGPVAFVCDERRCFARTTEPGELAAALSHVTTDS